MKKIVQLLVFGLIMSCTYSKAQNTALAWQSEKIIIDGNNSDWKNIPRYYNANMGLSYDIRNDSANLYVVFDIPDVMLQIRLLQTGFHVSFKIKTKPKIITGITFPKLSRDALNLNAGIPNISTVVKKFLMENEPAILEGFVYSNGLIYSGYQDKKMVSFSINWNALGEMIYEFQIPIREFYGDNFNFSEIKKNVLNLLAKSEAFTKQAVPVEMPNKGEMGSSPGGGMSSPPGGGMGSPLGGGMSGSPGGGMGGSPGGMGGTPGGGRETSRSGNMQSSQKQLILMLILAEKE
jgi:hypothetical protein